MPDHSPTGSSSKNGALKAAARATENGAGAAVDGAGAAVNLIKEDPGGVIFSVHIQPRAAKNEVVGVHGGAVKVRLTAPPVEGAANELLVRFLAERLGVPRGRVRLLGGQTSRDKLLRVDGLDRTEVLARLGLS